MKNVCLTLVLTMVCGISICFAQDNSEAEYTSKGKLISEGRSESPNGELHVTTYKLEEINLSKSIDLKDKKKSIEKAFRLSIKTKEKLPFGNYLIWVNDFNSPARTIRPNETAIIIYQRNLPNGATIALSKPGKIGSNSFSALSETLIVPSEYATPWEEIQARTPVIKWRRINSPIYKYEIIIERAVEKCTSVAHKNYSIMLAIGDTSINVGCNNDEAITTQFTNEDFERLINGSEIALQFGDGEYVNNRRVIGRLNKHNIE